MGDACSEKPYNLRLQALLRQFPHQGIEVFRGHCQGQLIIVPTCDEGFWCDSFFLEQSLSSWRESERFQIDIYGALRCLTEMLRLRDQSIRDIDGGTYVFSNDTGNSNAWNWFAVRVDAGGGFYFEFFLMILLLHLRLI